MLEPPDARALCSNLRSICNAIFVERAIRNSSKPRATVLDCVGGSGTTMIAAERTGRRAVLLEIDPAYCDVILQRWQEETGQAAVLDGEDRTFADVSALRKAA
jgi:16S rRNA G966 N2-methylase RsmD